MTGGCRHSDFAAAGAARAVRKRDRRNTFARSQLRDAVMTHVHANPSLLRTNAEAAGSLRLPAALCDRLLAELVAGGSLVCGPCGFHAAQTADVV